MQFSSNTRDNISNKQTEPATVRPKTKIQKSQVDSGELDINEQSHKKQVCQIQIQNVQQTAMSIEKKHIYRFPPGTRTENIIASKVRNSYRKVQVVISQMKNQINPDTSQHTKERGITYMLQMNSS